MFSIVLTMFVTLCLNLWIRKVLVNKLHFSDLSLLNNLDLGYSLIILYFGNPRTTPSLGSFGLSEDRARDVT